MTHLSEEQLVELYYGDASGRGEKEEHLAACESCRTSYEDLRKVLAAVNAAAVPERDAEYGARVWQELAPRLAPRPAPRPMFDWRAWLAPRRLVPAAAIAALVIGAFVAGHIWWPKPQTPTTAVAPLSQPVRERILLVAVGDHLDRSQMLLLELANAEPPKDGTAGAATLDISSEQGRAQDLVESNRLYRQTAARTGDDAVASVLDELEPLLVDIAHSPSQISAGQLEEIRKRIEAHGILFKVRVIGSKVREREKSAAPAPGQKTL